MIEIVIRGITDEQIKAIALNSNLTVEDIVSFLANYTKPKYIIKPDNRKPVVSSKHRLQTFNPDRKCYTCGKFGHTKASCRAQPQQRLTLSGSSSKITCTFCQKVGHKVDVCFVKSRFLTRGTNQRNVNFCKMFSKQSSDSNISTAVIQAINVSLISSDIIKHLSCQRKPTLCVLKGLGNNGIGSREFVTLTIEFPNISLDVDFVVVPAPCMNTPIIIGTDVLNRDGVVFVRTKDSQYLTREAHGNAVQSAKEPISIKTPIQGAELDLLMSVIMYFQLFFISGTASTTV